MNLLLIIQFILPFIAFSASLLFKNHQEKLISRTVTVSAAIQLVVSIVQGLLFLISSKQFIQFNLLNIYKTSDFEFRLDTYYDVFTGIFTTITAFILFIVLQFSRTYMHRESGFKRFFNHLMLFNAGLNVLFLAGNFETFFLGWEIVGICSFLLIAFYRERYLPVRNAMKVLSFYRIGDVALLGAVWFSHHVFEQNISFHQLLDSAKLVSFLQSHPIQSVFIGFLFTQAAMVKSAQFPFFNWLPRAMEGPTVSSAIFYGSLSAHIGVYTLIRTQAIWSTIPAVQLFIVVIGIITVLMTYLTTLVQSTAKTQIAYATITQIGLMFIEIGMGWYVFASIHFALHALLRTYQLLISPSVLSYLVHLKMFDGETQTPKWLQRLPERIKYTLYWLSVKEWNLDQLWYQQVWKRFKQLGNALQILRNPVAEITFVLLVLVAGLGYFILPASYFLQYQFISWFYAVSALCLVLIAWTERKSALRAWVYIVLCQLFFVLSIIEQHTFDWMQVALYLSGTIGAFLGGMYSLQKVRSIENSINLNSFHGHVYEHPKMALLFLISALTMAGFPISPTFIGFDILFSDIEPNHTLLLICSSLTFVLIEISVLRIYARVFLGLHVKTYHEVAFRSS